MLHELKNSGLPLYFNDETGLLVLSAPLTYSGFAAKKLEQMSGLFEDDHQEDPSEPIYDVYRNIRFPEDEERLQKDHYAYDITVVKAGMINDERKKTSGHYHSWNELKTSTYPEVYEVIAGTAIYVLQRADNFDDPNYDDLNIQDLILVKVKAGQSIIIPPNYGHCSINAGEGELIFSNLAYTPCKVAYAPVQYYHGMGAYIGCLNGKITVKKNPHYKELPAIKYAEVKEQENLGILFHKPMYQTYRERPSAFAFLGHVDPFTEDIMNMLDYKEEF